MTINGLEVNFKISNLKHAGAMKQALTEMGEKEAKIRGMDYGDLTTILAAMIAMFREFFLTATGEDVLAECEDLQEARDAYELFLGEIEGQKKTMLAPYSPTRIK